MVTKNLGNQCHAVASWSQHGIQFAPEACYGEKPDGSGTNIDFKAIRKVSFNPTLSRDQIKSGEVRADRLDGKTSLGNNSVSGELTGELSFGSYDDLFEALTCGIWIADKLAVGVQRRSFFSVESFSDINEYRQTTGLEVNTLKLSVALNAKISVTWGMVGSGLDYTTKEFVGANWGVPTDNEPGDTFSGEIKVDGATVATITSIELNADNGIEPLFVLFNTTAERSSINPFILSGTMAAYFENDTLFKKFANSERQKIEFTLDMDGGSYTFDMPNCIFSEAGTATGSGNIPINLSFVADHDGKSPIYITRKAVSSIAIKTQPSEVTASVGSKATLEFSVSGATDYQWKIQKSGTGSFVDVTDVSPYSGAKTETLNIDPTDATENGDKFKCIASNQTESIESNEVTLTVS